MPDDETRAPAPLGAERLDEIRAAVSSETWCTEECISHYYDEQTGRPYPCPHRLPFLTEVVPDLLAHIDRLTADLERATRERDAVREALIHRCASARIDFTCEDCQKIIVILDPNGESGMGAPAAAAAGEGEP